MIAHHHHFNNNHTLNQLIHQLILITLLILIQAQGIDDDPVVISNNGPLTAVLAVLPLQMIAYELAILKHINPDTPRNLAKAVTTD